MFNNFLKTESNFNMYIGKVWTAIDKLTAIWKFYLCIKGELF